MGASYEELSPTRRALYSATAAIVNVVPITSAFVAPLCLPGYILCKLAFAGISVVAAAEQFALGGDADTAQTRAILYRGFQGDWYVTGKHVAGFAAPQPWPDPPPPKTESDGTFEPPPL